MPPDSDAPGNEPNLELPGFGLGRKKKRARKSVPTVEGPALEDAASEVAPVDEAATTPAPAPPPTSAAPPVAPAATPASARAVAASAAPTPARAPARPAARPPARPAARPPSRPARPEPVEEPTQVLETPAPVTPAPVTPAAHTSAAQTPALETPAAQTPVEDAQLAPRLGRGKDRAEARARRRAEKGGRERSGSTATLALPTVKPLYAALISGVLSGLAAVLLALGASRGCEAVRDTSSCGGAGGLLALIAILALEVAIGATLLKAWQIADPASTSFLGVGIVATIAMLVFLDQLDSPWMLLVIPLMTAATFALSWWVTVSFIDEHPMPSEVDSERGDPAFAADRADSSEDGDPT